ncbi:MAG: acyl-CoA dehydratase activase [Bacteroidota bacterium]
MEHTSASQNSKIHLGIDIGSISINTILMNSEQKIIDEKYIYTKGRTFHVLMDLLNKILKTYGKDSIKTVAFTGSGGKQATELIGGSFVNEIIAQSTSVGKLYPQVKTIIEMGGEDSKLIFMEEQKASTHSQLSDFAMNSLCAAGTGSFLDQQAKRIGVSIENEFGNLALMSEKPPRIAGRCSVFAKSDMIHLQQIATPLHDIVAGLCFAVARNFKSSVGRGKKFIKPFSFQGGVAANEGMVRAFKEIFDLNENEIIIPKHYASMGAIGALSYIMNHPEKSHAEFNGLTALETYLKSNNKDNANLGQLKESKAVYNKEIIINKNGNEKIEVFLGIDVGSLSTNVVLIDKDNNVVSRRYLPTASKPINAIQRGLKEVYEEIGNEVIVKAVGTTGSGRYLTGDFIGADIIQNEITAQATAAIAYDSTVDTIFEIGGQDSKYISIENGVVVDFEMNKVCAAGTGSFLEEQAEKLDINIIKEFGDMALNSEQPVRLGSRCTVFMESDLNSHQQKGAEKENLVGGLAYSIVQNYIQKVVGDKPIGNKIFFQGGVTNNKSVVAAFEKITGKSIIIPPHFDVTGAIGAAILARESLKDEIKTRFKGFDVGKVKFTLDRFTCKSCSNQCEIQRVRIDGEKKALYYGGRCEKYEVEERKGKGLDIPNLFEERIQMIMGDYKETEQSKNEKNKTTIGIPRGLMLFYQQFPFWRTFFEELNFDVVISDESDQQLVKKSLELMVAETCLPVELIHGHVENLLKKEVDHIFIPFIVNVKADKDNPTSNCNCPWVQSHPFMVRSAFTDEKVREKFLIPTLHIKFFGRVLNEELSKFMKMKFGISKSKTVNAIKKADLAQTLFEQQIKTRGKEVMNNLPKDKKALVILGRPYNTNDPFLNLRLVEKLINQDTLPIPVDFLPLHEENIFDDYKTIYWPNSQKILAATRIIHKNDNLYGVFLGNFRCGPDSFVTHFVREEMNGKPYLHLEVDEHSADAGMITRCEAFLDSLEGYQKVKSNQVSEKQKHQEPEDKLEGRTLYLPYASDQVHMIAAAARSIGIKAEVLPMQDETDLEIARKYTNGQECFPMICTTGSFLKKLMEPDCDPKKASFFMPDHNGPCRFGEYNKLQKVIFNRLGYHDATILTPSNDDSYAALAKENSGKFRFNAWKGFVAEDLLRKLLQEKRPYELIEGQANKTYQKHFNELIKAIETGEKSVGNILKRAGQDFSDIQLKNGRRKPVVAVVGEIFMRDNPFCSSFLIDRLEALGAETIIAPFSEWIQYSTYRYWRDSKWKGDLKGLFKSKIQEFAQHVSANSLTKNVRELLVMKDEIEVKDMLKRCEPYIHRDYDGDPPIAIGSASALVEQNISGVVHIMPFTCMPGTLICSVTNDFRKDHNNIPWENFAYDGQEDAAIDTRLQAFMHQVEEYCTANKLYEITKA